MGEGSSANADQVKGSFGEISKVDEEGFQIHWGRQENQGRGGGIGLGRSFSFNHGRGGREGGDIYNGAVVGNSVAGILAKPFGSGAGPLWEQLGEEHVLSQGIFSNPKYFKKILNGDFDSEQYEDETDWEAEIEDEELGEPPEKREALTRGPQNLIEDGQQKSGRFEPSEVLSLC